MGVTGSLYIRGFALMGCLCAWRVLALHSPGEAGPGVTLLLTAPGPAPMVFGGKDNSTKSP